MTRRAILSDITDLKLDPKKAHRGVASGGRLKVSSEETAAVPEKNEKEQRVQVAKKTDDVVAHVEVAIEETTTAQVEDTPAAETVEVVVAVESKEVTDSKKQKSKK